MMAYSRHFSVSIIAHQDAFVNKYTKRHRKKLVIYFLIPLHLHRKGALGSRSNQSQRFFLKKSEGDKYPRHLRGRLLIRFTTR